MSQLVQKVFVSAGFILNVLKSHFDPGPEREFIGYLVNCSDGDPSIGCRNMDSKSITGDQVGCGRN